MGAAVRDRGEQDRRADGECRRGVLRQQFRGNVSLVVQHDHEGVEALHMKHGVGAKRAGDGDTVGHRRINGGVDDLDLLAAEQAAFAGMGVQAADRNPRCGNAHALQRAGGLIDDTGDTLARDRLERLTDALVQGRMGNSGAAKAQHHEDVVFGRSGLARHERRMAVEWNAGERDRSFVLRGGDDGSDLPGEGGFHRGAAECERRSSGCGAHLAEGDALLLRAVQNGELISGFSGVFDVPDRMQVDPDSAGVGVRSQDLRIAHQDRAAGGPHRRVERGLQADLRPDARRVPGRDRNDRFVGCHGVFYGPESADAIGWASTWGVDLGPRQDRAGRA